MRMLCGMLVLALLASGAAMAQERGDWVLGQWRGGAYWFPGVVESRSGDRVTVAYDDGTRETVTLRQLRPYDWTLGTRVECRWAGGTEWYSGRISAISADGIMINIQYDDGDQEQTSTGACRSR